MEYRNLKIFFSISVLLLSFQLFSQDIIPYLPYQGKMKQITTKHFVVIFPEKYSLLGQKTANYAEEIHEKLKDFIEWHPNEKTNIILSDQTDYPNGYGIPFLRNTIGLYLAPSDLANSLNTYKDPLYTLLLHEYTHILHLDQIRGSAFVWRALYGKLYHPLINTFRWYFEGVAVLSETMNSEGGRLKSAYNYAIIRDAALHKKIPDYDRLVLPVVDFPHGDSIYHYGAKFIEYIYNTYGKEKFDQIYLELSDDFCPFIFMFALNFKKIYGKSLDKLWNEWKLYEEKLAENEKDLFTEGHKITNFEGEITDFDKKGNTFLIASSSYKNDRILYTQNDKKIEKIKLGYFRSVSFTNDNNYIVYTKSTAGFDNIEYFDLYSLNLKNRIEKRLTKNRRINYVTFSKESTTGLFVSHNPYGSELFKGYFEEGTITSIKRLIMPSDISFVDKPAINDDGTRGVISCKTQDGKIKVFLIDLLNDSFKEMENLTGRNPHFVNNDEFTLTYENDNTTTIIVHSINTDKTDKLLSSIGVIKSIPANDKIYYTKYSFTGVEIFSSKMVKTEMVKNSESSLSGDQSNDLAILKGKAENYKIKDYNGFRNWYPTLWGLLPTTIPNSGIYIETTKDNYFNIPFISPQLFIFNQSTLGRFSYKLSVSYDYLRNYPVNSLSLLFKNPYITLSYYWSNWMDGNYIYIYNSKKNGFIYNYYNNRFPICFSNELNLSSKINIDNNSEIAFSTTIYHVFNEYNSSQKKLTNKLIFNESFSFYYILSRAKSSRWDRGVTFGIYGSQSIQGLLNNLPIYYLTTYINGRIPFANSFFFMNNSFGIDFLFNNNFTAGAPLFKISESLVGSDSNDSYSIDLKAFAKEISSISSGSIFYSLDIGLDTTVYKRTHYSKFGTLGFKEFYLKNYSEFVFLYNKNLFNTQYRGILFDQVIELHLDFFVAYGNVSCSIVNGAAIGYRIGDKKPAWNVFTYLSFSL